MVTLLATNPWKTVNILKHFPENQKNLYLFCKQPKSNHTVPKLCVLIYN